jgi:hypothetical protein
MSRQSPAGFILGVIAEVAAVVLVLAFLPRFDFAGAPAKAAMPETDPMIHSVADQRATAGPTRPRSDSSTIPSFATSEAIQETSYYKRSAPPSFPVATDPISLPNRQPPPLIVVDPERPRYVEQRLDRASQQLINSVGSFAVNAADEMTQNHPAAAAQPVASLTAAATLTRPTARSTNQPKPWIRY